MLFSNRTRTRQKRISRKLPLECERLWPPCAHPLPLPTNCLGLQAWSCCTIYFSKEPGKSTGERHHVQFWSISKRPEPKIGRKQKKISPKLITSFWSSTALCKPQMTRTP